MTTLRKQNGEIDSTRVAVLIGLSIGLGLVVHEGFFLLAGAIAAGTLTAAAVHALHGYNQNARGAR